MTLILWIQSHCETEKSFVKASKGKTLALPESHYFPIEYANWKTIHLWLRIFLSYSQRDSKAFFSWRKTLTHIPILHNDYFLDPEELLQACRPTWKISGHAPFAYIQMHPRQLSIQKSNPRVASDLHSKGKQDDSKWCATDHSTCWASRLEQREFTDSCDREEKRRKG